MDPETDLKKRIMEEIEGTEGGVSSTLDSSTKTSGVWGVQGGCWRKLSEEMQYLLKKDTLRNRED